MMHHLLLLCLLLVLGRTHAQSNNNRQIQRYPLPAFSMLLKVRVDELSTDDDAEVYLDLQVFQETLERVTQLHLTDVFQQAEGRVEFDEKFLRIQLSSKVRQDIAVEPDHHQNQRVHVPLHAGFSGVVSYSFPQGVLPSEDRVDMLVEELLESALVAENYMLLFRRYLSSGVLADIEDVQDIRIGTQLLNVAETPPPKHEEHIYDETIDNTSHNNDSHKKHLNAVTIVAIVIFLTLSCLLMLFGATVVLLMKDRARQEEKYTGQTMTSIGMGTNKKKEDGTLNEDEDDNDSDDDEDTAVTTTPAWKRAVLPVLRKAVMVRRYWRKHMRKQKFRNTKTNAAPTTPVAVNPNEAASATNFEHEDDGLNDEDVYYDENLSDEEAASQWLDAWQASITSIPVRTIASSRQVPPGSSPNKRKKKKQSKAPLAPHPAKRQSKKAFLCCIAEEDSVVETNSIMDPDDLELGASPRSAVGSPRNGGKNNTTKICLELDRIQELASVIMEEEYPKKVPVSPAATLSPRSPDTPAALVSSASFPGASSSLTKSKKKLTGFDEGDYEGLERIQDVDLS